MIPPSPPFMDSPDIDHLLKDAAREPGAALPSGFSRSVLRQARQWRDFTRANRRLLTVASIAAVGIAFAVAQWAGTEGGAIDQPPRLTLFQAGDFAAPLDTE